MNAIYEHSGIEKTESHKYAHHFNPHDEWHTYTLEWTPHYLSWSIDGHEVRLVREPEIVDRMDMEQSLRMNFWTPEFHMWGRGLDARDMPWYLMFDYVEVFTYDTESNEFNLHWRDDFETFDADRWQKQSGGFAQNSSVFYPENVSVKAGHLVLKMEPDVEHHHRHVSHQ